MLKEFFGIMHLELNIKSFILWLFMYFNTWMCEYVCVYGIKVCVCSLACMTRGGLLWQQHKWRYEFFFCFDIFCYGDMFLFWFCALKANFCFYFYFYWGGLLFWVGFLGDLATSLCEQMKSHEYLTIAT